MPLKPASSPQARQAISTAFAELEQTITPEDSRDFNVATIEKVRDEAKVIEDQIASRKWLRNMRRLMPLFQGLEHYAKSMEVLCNGTPFLPWAWAPITLILRISSEHVEAFERVVKGYAKIGDCLDRFKTLALALGRNLEFQQTLAAFYVDILKFHKQAYKFVRRRNWKLFFVTSWGRFERTFGNIIEDLEYHGKLVDLQANAQHVLEARNMREEIKTWREESLVRTKQLDDKQTAKEAEAIISWLKADEGDQVDLLDALSTEAVKFAGTCSWVLKNEKIKTWLQETMEFSSLSLQGNPGSGKSVLVTQITTFMKASNMFSVHHFCSQRYPASTTYDQILRSIILQLLRQDNELVPHVYKDYVIGRKPPTAQALERLVHTLVTNSSQEPRKTEYIWIIIDGLNECDNQTQSSVLNLATQLTSKNSSTGGTVCKILISSRASPIISKRLRAKTTISLTEERESIKDAIREYVHQRLGSLREKLRQLNLGQKEIAEIETIITNKGDGMFLYARLVLDYLSSNIFYSGEEMKASISELPNRLSEFYQKILIQTLVQLNPQSVERIRCIFAWIAFAKRPLKKMEFLSALTFSDGNANATNLVPRYVLDICGVLVEEQPDTTLAFIHISVKEFLMSPDSNLVITKEQTDVEHARATLACLQSGVNVFLKPGPEHDRIIRVVKGFHGFHVYATEFWTEYILQLVSIDTLNAQPAILALASGLATSLQDVSGQSDATPPIAASDLPDERLTKLDEFPLLQLLIQEALKSRSLKQLETNIRQEAGHQSETARPTSSKGLKDGNDDAETGVTSEQQPAKDPMSKMLAVYQKTVRFLLDQTTYSGVSADDLSLFKRQFQNSAFTCRLKFCPRATTGFSTEEQCRLHEIAHTHLVTCTYPDCHYPPFTSLKTLRKHVKKNHLIQPILRPIRQNRNGVTQRSTADLQRNADRHTHSFPPLLQEEDTLCNPIEDDDSLEQYSQPWEDEVSIRSAEEMWQSFADPVNSRPTSPTLDWPPVVSGIQIDHMGFLRCSVYNCGAKVCDGVSESMYPEAFYHYWHWHHADGIPRCAEPWCQRTFSTREALQNHYINKHCTLLCKKCDLSHAEEFTMLEELRQHWRSEHLTLVRRWVCRLDLDAEVRSMMILLPSDCHVCSNQFLYSTERSAIDHMKGDHRVSFEASSNDVHTFIKEIAGYVEASTIDHDNAMEDSDHSDTEDNKIRPGHMFYVEDLAS